MKRTELLNALTIVKPGLANREMIEQSSSFAFIQGRVVTYNDEISISHPVAGLEIEGAIKADELYALLNKLTREEIDISTHAGKKSKQVHLQSGKARAKFTLQQKIKLPLERELGVQEGWKPLPGGFLDAIRFAIPTCSNDQSLPKLTCICVQKDGRVEASDGFRLTRYKIDPMPSKMFLLPASSATELVRYNITRIAEGKGWVHFRTKEKTIFSCRIMEGEDFPDISEFLQVKGKRITPLPIRLVDILDRAAIFSKRDHLPDDVVTILIEDDILTVKSKSDTGHFEETTKIQYSGEPISFLINPAFLKAVVSQLRSCVLGKDKLRFESENWEHVIVLSTKGPSA